MPATAATGRKRRCVPAAASGRARSSNRPERRCSAASLPWHASSVRPSRVRSARAGMRCAACGGIRWPRHRWRWPGWAGLRPRAAGPQGVGVDRHPIHAVVPAHAGIDDAGGRPVGTASDPIRPAAARRHVVGAPTRARPATCRRPTRRRATGRESRRLQARAPPRRRSRHSGEPPCGPGQAGGIARPSLDTDPGARRARRPQVGAACPR